MKTYCVLLLFLQIHASLCSQGPLLSWGINCRVPDVDTTLNNLAERSKKLLVFYQPELSVEDITLHGNNDLKELVGENFIWVPSVNNPSSQIQNLNSWKETNLSTISNDVNGNTKTLIYRLSPKKSGGNLEEYQAHNVELMKDVIASVGDAQVFAVLTGDKELAEECNDGLSTIKKRHTLEAVDLNQGNSSGAIFNISGNLLMFTSLVKISMRNNGKLIQNTLDLQEAEGNGTIGNSSSSLTLNFPNSKDFEDIEMRMDFEIGNSKWMFANFTATMKISNGEDTEISFNTSSLVIPKDFSYTCHDATFRSTVNDSNTPIEILFQQLQIQPAFVKHSKFSKPYDCLGVLSIPIWMGLVVSIVFTVILLVGSYLMMSIKAMDKFDDPKGKTITIAATD